MDKHGWKFTDFTPNTKVTKFLNLSGIINYEDGTPVDRRNDDLTK
jgi:hypothetical protein